MLVTRGHKNAKFRQELLSKLEKETKAEKKTKGEKENSSSPILYNVILAISEEMVGRRANLKAQRGYYSISLGIPRYLRIFLGIQEYSRVSKDIQRKVHAWSRTESLFSLVKVKFRIG